MKVFVSSTSDDLGPFRQAAEQVILDLHCHPVGMEHFGADGSLGILDACARRLEECDVVLAIVAWRRGGVPVPERGDDGKKSFTAWEIEAAKKAGKPVLVLMARGTWPGNLYEETDEGRAWMREFRQELDRLAVLFDWEEVKVGEKEPLPVFRAKVREVLVEHMRTAPRQAESSPAARRLPARPPYCFGREDEVEALVAALLDSPPPPVPVLGPGGAGKSTIALAALHDPRVAARYGKRRFFVRCDAATGRAALVSEIARTLGIEPGTAPEGKVLAGLGRSPAVLVLDNAETPLWGSEMAAVEELLAELAALPGLALVATLRGDHRPGGLAWRQALQIGPLSLPAAREAFLAVAGQQYQDDSDLNPLLEAVGRLAIAVALLAHQAEGDSRLAGLRRRWQDERTELLRRGEAEDRLTNLAVSLELSIGSRRMTAEAKRLLSLLALLPDGVAREGDLQTLLPARAEAAASVLRQVGLAFWQGERLRALSPVREHVRRHRPPRPGDLERAVDLYLEVARLGEKLGTEGGAEAAARVAAELGNVQAMLLQGFKRSEPTIEAACDLGTFLRFTGLGTLEVLEQARKTAQEQRDAGAEARCVERLGDIARTRSDHAAARSFYEQALPLYRTVGSLLGEANCFHGLGDIALDRSDHAAAHSLYEQALPLYRQVGALLGEANCLKGLGDSAFGRSDHVAARSLYEQALPLYQRIGGLLGQANCFWGLGDIALEKSDHAAARSFYQQALPLYRHAGALLGEAVCIARLGELALLGTDHAAACSLFEQAMPLFRRVGDLLGEANCIKNLGDIARESSDHNAARSLYEQALATYERFGDPYSIGRAYVSLARASQDPEERRQHVAAARTSWLSIQRPDLVERLLKEFEQEGPP